MNNKRGLSIVIGYILLVAVSIVMSIIVYQYLKTYVPKDTVKCDEGTSAFIKDTSYNCTSRTLNVTLKNNGKFSINGYFIHASNKTGEALPTLDLSLRIMTGGITTGNSITFSDMVENALSPDEPNEKKSSFNTTGYGTIYKIEIIPTRMQEVDGKKRLISCSDSKVEAELTCMA